MPEAADIFARLDAIMAELAELRAEVVASLPASGTGADCAGGAPIITWVPK